MSLIKPQNNQNSKKGTSILLIIYLIVMTWIILFKMELDIHALQEMRLRSINFIPFAGSLIVNGKVVLSEIILNIIVFVPFGIYMSMIFDKWGFFKKLAPIFAVSLLYETFQYIFAIGASDITDLIDNTLGGAIGIGFFFVLQRLFGKRTVTILNILAVIGTVLVVLFLGLLMIANM